MDIKFKTLIVFFLLLIIFIIIQTNSVQACMTMTSISIKSEKYSVLSNDDVEQNNINLFCNNLAPQNVVRREYYECHNYQNCSKEINYYISEHFKKYEFCGLSLEDVNILAELSDSLYQYKIIDQTEEEYNKFIKKTKWENFWRSKNYKKYVDINREGTWTKYKEQSPRRKTTKLC